MKVEKISENQIKLTLTSSDLKENNIRLDDLTKPNEKAQELFKKIMEKAFTQCGFEVDDTPLMVEATPISLDGLMIIVTKLPEKASPKDSLSLISQNKELRRYKKKNIEHIKKSSESEDNLIIYSFKCFDNAVDAALRIANTFSGYSELYRHDKKYFLILQNNTDENIETTESVLSEYGDKYTNNILAKYLLMEHGETLIHNPAVKIISDNFS